MSATNRSKRQSPEYWGKLVQECIAGSHKKADFCRERGLNYATFMSHHTRLNKKTHTDTPGNLIAMKLMTNTDASGPEREQRYILCSLSLKNGTVLNIYDKLTLSDLIGRVMSDAAIL